MAGDENKRAFAPVDLHVIETAPAFIATACEFAALQHAGRTVLKIREDADPIVEVVRLAAAHGMPLLQVRHEPLHRADEEMRKINAMTQHVAEFARAGELLDLAPTDAARAPVL